MLLTTLTSQIIKLWVTPTQTLCHTFQIFHFSYHLLPPYTDPVSHVSSMQADKHSVDRAAGMPSVCNPQPPTHTPATMPPPPHVPSGSINTEYKSKLRSLAFNLRDPHNPDLRAHVLVGEILASALVRMSPADLANKDLAEWRRKVEEEHNKAIELDVEAAAKV